MKHLSNLILITLLALATACSNGGKEPKTEQNEPSKNADQEAQNLETTKKSDELLIVGSNIWIRSKPSTGEVVMKLNDGDKCKILEKGKKEQIRGMVDYWYKISFNGKEGWVFGSQTNIKSNEEPVLEDFAEFLPKFIEATKSKTTSKKYIHPQIGVYTGNNPGAVCTARNEKNPEIKISQKVSTSNIFGRKPKGDFCKGYAGEKNGFYYYEITPEKLPSFGQYTDDGNIISVGIDIPANLETGKFIKVTTLFDEYYSSDYYFVSINYQWYFICQNFCDCSA